MSGGRKKVKIYEYNPEGGFIKSYENMSVCREILFSEKRGKYPILRLKIGETEFGKTPSGNYLFKERLGRAAVKMLHKIDKSEYCSDLIRNDSTPIGVYNLEGVLLIMARNINILDKMLNLPKMTAYHQLKRGLKGKTKGEFIFKYIKD